jgi:hypothetical protein
MYFMEAFVVVRGIMLAVYWGGFQSAIRFFGYTTTMFLTHGKAVLNSKAKSILTTIALASSDSWLFEKNIQC